jgi:hypothetical protein
MNNMNRRSALALSLAATSAVVVTKSVTAQPYAPTQGTEIAPGVRCARSLRLKFRRRCLPALTT